AAVEMLEQLEVPASRYEEALIAATGQITSDILDVNVALRVLARMRDRALDGFASGGPSWLFKTFVFVLILAAFRAGSLLTRRFVEKSVNAANLNLSQLLKDTLVAWSARLVILIGLLVALSQLGIQIGPLLAGLGIAGFVLGFALQDTLSNFAAGAMILLYRPFDVGDLVEAAGVRGVVQRMTLVSTTILIMDNQTLIVPNNKIWGDVILNVTAQQVRRVDLVFGIGYGDDIDKADSVLRDILEKHPQVLDEPEPVVEVHNLGDSSVDFVVRPWVKTEDYWPVHWSITREVKQRFDREGISIPFPQQDVHHYVERTKPS
ncbi:MAG: mechanosensitive ion channel family protein, partial [Myxococcota bacterium]